MAADNSDHRGTVARVDGEALGRALQQAVPGALKGATFLPDRVRAEAFRASAAAKRARGDTGAAIADYSEAIRLDPSSAETFQARGYARREKGDYEGAIADYTETIRLDPQRADAYALRAGSRFWLGDLERSRADADKAIRLDPHNLLGFNNRGVTRYAQRDYGGAVEDHTQAIRIDPSFVRAWNGRGNARTELGDLEGGLADYSEALRLNPDYSPSRIARAHYRRASGDLNGALEDYLVARRLPGTKGVLANLCVTRFRLGQREEAMADCALAKRQSNANDAHPFTMEAGVRLLGGDLNGAEMALSEALRREPNEGYALCLKAILHAKRSGLSETEREAAFAKQIGSWWRPKLREIFGDDLFR